jgi:allantoicase
VVAVSDDFFAPAENLLRTGAPAWREGEYTERGKWMDGWESRRRRDFVADDHDWCVIRLGSPGIVRGVDVETTHFKGNHPEACSLDVCTSEGPLSIGDLQIADWREALPRSPLRGDAHHLLEIDSLPATHVRLRIFPDGGVARLRVYGQVVVDWDRLRRRGEVDLAAVEHGGAVVACSDMFFGSRHNLLMPGDARGMSDGWETKRRRGTGHDWAIVQLGAPGTIGRVEVDTRHFKGNAPGACSLDVCTRTPAGGGPAWDAGVMIAWQELLPRGQLQPNARHFFEDQLPRIDDVTHARLNIYPDGGVSRLRLFGRPR